MKARLSENGHVDLSSLMSDFVIRVFLSFAISLSHCWRWFILYIYLSTTTSDPQLCTIEDGGDGFRLAVSWCGCCKIMKTSSLCMIVRSQDNGGMYGKSSQGNMEQSLIEASLDGRLNTVISRAQ